LRKAKATIAEHGADQVALILQGKLDGSKRPMCRSQPQALSPAEPVPIGSNPLGAGRR
jgi:hypothetical protein